jgi:hypothetical protein
MILWVWVDKLDLGHKGRIHDGLYGAGIVFSVACFFFSELLEALPIRSYFQYIFNIGCA